MAEPESWAKYDEWLESTLAELEAHPYDDWAHSHGLFPYVLSIVQKHFGVSERGQYLVAASLTGGIVAAAQGGTDEQIQADFIKPWHDVKGGQHGNPIGH